MLLGVIGRQVVEQRRNLPGSAFRRLGEQPLKLAMIVLCGLQQISIARRNFAVSRSLRFQRLALLAALARQAQRVGKLSQNGRLADRQPMFQFFVADDGQPPNRRCCELRPGVLCRQANRQHIARRQASQVR